MHHACSEEGKYALCVRPFGRVCSLWINVSCYCLQLMFNKNHEVGVVLFGTEGIVHDEKVVSFLFIILF